jgi:MFS family permease
MDTANPARRGATMELHSMCGYAGGLFGPLVVGMALDTFGRDTVIGWSIGFGHAAIVTLLALWMLRRLTASVRRTGSGNRSLTGTIRVRRGQQCPAHREGRER